MASARTAPNEGPLVLLSNSQQNNAIAYTRFLMPCMIRPRKSAVEMVFADETDQKPSIAPFFINKQV